MKLLEFVNLTESDYDCWDTEYDACVTVCHVGEENDEYDCFCNSLMSKVDIIDSTNGCILIVDWSGFIKRNHDKLKNFSRAYWHNSFDDDDGEFVYQWIHELNAYVAGYVAESFYTELCELLATLE